MSGGDASQRHAGDLSAVDNFVEARPVHVQPRRLPAQLRNTLITRRRIVYPVTLPVRVSPSVLSQTIKPIKMEVN